MNLETLKGIVEAWGYLMVFFGIAIESAGIPFPGETVLLIASAIAAGSAKLHIEWVIFWAAVGAIFGDNCGYWAGREIGQPILNKVGPILRFDEKKRAKLEGFFAKHGAKTVFIGRFVAVLRAWAAFFAGMNRMHYQTFLFYNALGGIVWALGVGLLGFFFGSNLPLLERILGDFTYAVLGIIILGAIIFYIRHKAKNKAVREEN